jgi:SepF-like predicted cell division protein (DUF552 family)
MRVVGLIYNNKRYDRVEDVEDAIREYLSGNINISDIPDEWIEHELDNNVEVIEEEL